MGYYFDDRNSAAWSYGDDAGRIIDLLGTRFRMAKLSMPPPIYTVRRPRALASWWSATVLFRCG